MKRGGVEGHAAFRMAQNVMKHRFCSVETF